jgi:hypothetical protein
VGEHVDDDLGRIVDAWFDQADDAVPALKDKPGRDCRCTAAGSSHARCTTPGWSTSNRLLVFPVVLGSGKRLFADGAATSAYTLLDSEVTSAGVIHQVLRPTVFGTGEFMVEDGHEAVRRPG